MAQAYYSLVLNEPAEAVWAVIRPFGHYSWAGVESETIIEDGKADDQVGAIRRVAAAGRIIRQKLLAHSDLERAYTYTFCDPSPFPVRHYVATIRVRPVVETGAAFAEWSATFDCPDGDEERWRRHFEGQGFALWLAALRAFMTKRAGA